MFAVTAFLDKKISSSDSAILSGIIFGLRGGATITAEYVGIEYPGMIFLINIPRTNVSDLDHLISTFIDRDLIKSMKRIFG